MQQLCEDTGCGPEDLPETMNNREKWRERVRDIRACGTTWWWWKVKTLHFKQFSLAWVRSLHVKTILFQAIQFCASTQFSSIWPIHRALLGATTLGQSGRRSDGNEGVLRIPQSSRITGTSPPDCLVSCPGPSLKGGCYTPLQRSRRVFYSTSWLGNVSGLGLFFCLMSYQPSWVFNAISILVEEQ